MELNIESDRWSGGRTGQRLVGIEAPWRDQGETAVQQPGQIEARNLGQGPCFLFLGLVSAF